MDLSKSNVTLTIPRADTLFNNCNIFITVNKMVYYNEVHRLDGEEDDNDDHKGRYCARGALQTVRLSG